MEISFVNPYYTAFDLGVLVQATCDVKGACPSMPPIWAPTNVAPILVEVLSGRCGPSAWEFQWCPQARPAQDRAADFKDVGFIQGLRMCDCIMEKRWRQQPSQQERQRL